MKIRELEPHEIPAAMAVDGAVFPEKTIVIGAFDKDGHLVGRTALMALVHIEGTWVSEVARGGFTAIRLVKKAEQTLAERGFTSAVAYTPDDNPKIGEYLKRVGYTRVPLSVWHKPVG